MIFTGFGFRNLGFPCILLVFGRRGSDARTDGRTDARTDAVSAPEPPPTHAGKKYAVRGDPPLTPIYTVYLGTDAVCYAIGENNESLA